MEILSQMWSLLGLLTVLQNVLPTQLLSVLHSLYESLQDLLSPYSYFEIPEFNGYCGVELNDLYRHVHLYLNAVNHSSATACRRLTLSRSPSSNRISFAVAPNHTVHDTFNNHRLSWTHHVDTMQDSVEEKRSFTLRFPKRHRHALLSAYLSHVTSRAEEFERVSRERRLFTNNNGTGSFESGWVSVPFRHPSTFETLALEPDLKKQIKDDLTAFASGKEFYHRVGRAWKRGYLLHGPPGSGKSSLIAAMANFLCYDVYDLELTKVSDNSELRSLLIQTTNRSIIVIEDIDCSVDLTADRMSKKNGAKSLSKSKKHKTTSFSGSSCDESSRVTLSGLLNFTDGLWSCCGEERLVVFTTNHRDSVDPALVRCGRMDVHVSLSTCGVHAFRELAKNYLGLESHVMFEAIEGCIRSGGSLTPAHVGEILLRNRRDVDVAMREVLSLMQGRVVVVTSAADQTDNEELAMIGVRSPESVLLMGSPENWDSLSGKKRKEQQHGSNNLDKKVKFFVRLRSLTKSDSGR
ncbi:putative ATPase, AAA-type, core, AAA-type ATPase domain-containing protein [Medicago truncatula]|uniref:Chaperone BCS1-A-like protein, putative n=1 Tax=Medicago truncatula TaxID=3880 RepID=A0A072VJ57_MEDTR|nr:AAA-ATPase At4g25835 [Medicago truncatula]KEH38185.1 chaperone BCS1-A-like protein, putative [Medicago truncatula]RHN74319.1 putative ATPase, AAA-type, core, AAA-type ATPase domain-containing protein [Medicago truncatula]